MSLSMFVCWVKRCRVANRVTCSGVLTPAVPVCPTSPPPPTSPSRPRPSPLCFLSAPFLHRANTNSIIYARQKHSLITHELAHAPESAAPYLPPTAIKHSLKARYLILAHLSLWEEIKKINLRVIYICTAADIYTWRHVPEGLVLLPPSSGPCTETRKEGRWLILYSWEANKRRFFFFSFFFFLLLLFLENICSLYFMVSFAFLFSYLILLFPFIKVYMWLSGNVV